MLAGGAVLFVLAEGALPVLVLVAMGRVTGDIPGAVTDGLASPAGHRLLGALAVAGTIYALSLLRGPCEDALTATATARMDALMQRRLVGAVCAPRGHRASRGPGRARPAGLGTRASWPAGSPRARAMALVGWPGDRLTGVLACAVLATFRWWLGLGMLVAVAGPRGRLRARVRLQAARVRSAGEPLRRSWYLPGSPGARRRPRRCRVFGLGGWLGGAPSRGVARGDAPGLGPSSRS